MLASKKSNTLCIKIVLIFDIETALVVFCILTLVCILITNNRGVQKGILHMDNRVSKEDFYIQMAEKTIYFIELISWA